MTGSLGPMPDLRATAPVLEPDELLVARLAAASAASMGAAAGPRPATARGTSWKVAFAAAGVVAIAAGGVALASAVDREGRPSPAPPPATDWVPVEPTTPDRAFDPSDDEPAGNAGSRERDGGQKIADEASPPDAGTAPTGVAGQDSPSSSVDTGTGGSGQAAVPDDDPDVDPAQPGSPEDDANGSGGPADSDGDDADREADESDADGQDEAESDSLVADEDSDD